MEEPIREESKRRNRLCLCFAPRANNTCVHGLLCRHYLCMITVQAILAQDYYAGTTVQDYCAGKTCVYTGYYGGGLVFNQKLNGHLERNN